LVELDQDGVGGLFLDAPADELGVGPKRSSPTIRISPPMSAVCFLEASPVPPIEPVLVETIGKSAIQAR